MSDECQSRLSLSARVIILSEGYTLAVSHGRPGISQQVSGVDYLPNIHVIVIVTR